MELLWKYDLPTDESCEDFHYEGPLWVQGDRVYCICDRFANETYEAVLFIIDKNSGKTQNTLRIPKKTTIPSKFFLEEYGEKMIIYTGAFWLLHKDCLTELYHQTIEDEVNSHFIFENNFVFADRSSVVCIDLDANCLKWKVNLSSSKNYAVGDVSFFENTVSCYGNDRLLFLDIANGNCLNQIKIPRVDKLFHPIRMKDGSLLIGFTNWSNAGVLRYDATTNKVIWKSSRSFEGPLLGRNIFLQNDRVYWVKNDTELVCVAVDNGSEVFRTKTEPWLYSDLCFWNRQIYYGTAGRDGFLVSLDAENGSKNWARFLKNGCAYFDLYHNSAIVGDFEKKIYQIDLATGSLLQEFLVDGEVVGRIKVDRNDVYTVVWGNADQPIRLIKLRL